LNAKLEKRIIGSVSVVLLFITAWALNPDRAAAEDLNYSMIANATGVKAAEVVAFDEFETVQLVVYPAGGGMRNLSSGYGYRAKACTACSTYHQGADFTAGYGSRIYAITYGKVIDVAWHGGEGFSVRIQHYAEHGFANTETIYAHMIENSNKVNVGDWVVPGQVIGKIGSTGVSTGPHVHFEVIVNGNSIDPVAWLKQNGARNPKNK
jgi:murein DD-endopeptidase MepM/ murein hydrolase activator NlpD